MDVIILSRIQFAFTIAFHYLFPPLSIGLALMIVIFEGMYIKTKNQLYKKITVFWTRIFALTFALGVATGLVQVFAFGNNWAQYSTFVGDVFGSALAAEGIFAFFLEAGFIGLMLFGWEKVSAKMHYLATILVTIGAHFSAVWIVAANSWMQTPAGYKIVGEGREARAVITSFWDVIFNPSFLDRITHTILGAWVTGIFVVISVSAYYYLKKRHLDFSRVCMKVSLIVASVVLVLQLISADSTARGVSENQPEKFAALEGVYNTEPGTPMTVVGYVDTKQEKVVGLKIPKLLSFMTFRTFDGAVTGLKSFPKSDWCNVPWVFQFYHLMIYMWGAMVLAVLLGWIFWKSGRLEKSKWTLRWMVISAFFPYLANQAGWFTAEMGRQPWIVYKLMRTAQGISRSVHAEQVIGSLIMFICMYSLILFLFIFLFNRKVKHGPEFDHSDLEYTNPYGAN
ncbi:MAG: hypothetical protein SP1CHLAM54_09120 [Chlamydiia bacterium]|nr:hypothetical protein [Chlamydiia bacterium]MCH9615818.1 hypothetical protein [Chlamydiia bacterium]MCH9628779.1 hypothetical protein [Chlamydiia bacterium]